MYHFLLTVPTLDRQNIHIIEILFHDCFPSRERFLKVLELEHKRNLAFGQSPSSEDFYQNQFLFAQELIRHICSDQHGGLPNTYLNPVEIRQTKNDLWPDVPDAPVIFVQVSDLRRLKKSFSGKD
jgi:hypothetical protein